METSKLKKFAQFARRNLIEQVAGKMKLVLADDSAARRENADAVKKLEEHIKAHGKKQVIEKIAYIWFNRFCALRFMDVNRYSRILVVSPSEGQFQPEILAEAKMGHIDENMVPEKARQDIFAMLDGSLSISDPQQEAYRLLIVSICNFWHTTMPFMFERIADYTELLMPDDLLTGNSILAYTREAMTPDVCVDVEVIGWLYQFYISEKKDEVFAGLKKNKKITPENIPAATQLFTPHWIVKYLVENSLGRLWMLNRPESRLIDRMKYYIRPDTQVFSDQCAVISKKTENCTLETDNYFLKINSPEEIKICDPACGSGHMLTYGFDLLYAIYEEEGYDAKDIPRLILTKNLYGIEIDERAGELAAFALMMKARSRDRRFFRRKVMPNICILENIEFSSLSGQLSVVSDQLKDKLLHDLNLFTEADNFGSLLCPKLTYEQIVEVRQQLTEHWKLNTDNLLFHAPVREKIAKALQQTGYLNSRYHVVIANPPYMGGKGMNGRLKSFAQDNYKDSKSDLFAMFIERNLDLAQKQGLVAMITMQSWMFLSSFEKLRTRLLGQDTILSMAHLGARAFDSIGGEVVSTTAFILENSKQPQYKGGFLRLVDGTSEAEKQATLKSTLTTDNCKLPTVFYRASAADFKKIPGSPIVYWASNQILKLFQKSKSLSERIETREGLTTGSNDLFLRLWHEVPIKHIGFDVKDNEGAQSSGKHWFTYVKGGDFRRWSGNFEYIVNWFNDGEKPRVFKDPATGRVRSHNYNGDYAFRTGFTWSGISSGTFAVRHVPTGFMFDAKGPMGFPTADGEQEFHEGFLNSAVTNHLIKMLAPTLDFKLGHILNLPLTNSLPKMVKITCKRAVELSFKDWNYCETSWDFTNSPLLQPDYCQHTLKATYTELRNHWHDMTLEMQRLEEENNRIFIKAYGLQDELTPDVPLNEITLTCNPHYRYGGNKSEEKLEALLLADTMKEFISYAVGCMFGRYSLDASGLILANQEETVEDYFRIVQEKKEHPEVISYQSSVTSKEVAKASTENCTLITDNFQNAFTPDPDNVIPILDGEWFIDDITERFGTFLKVTFGHDHYEENLKFIQKAIGKDIHKYFLKDFYKEHIKTYKKRPIYWLFSSPKGSFNALIYMHRYRPDTVSVILNDYLREFRAKLIARREYLEQVSISASASKTEKTRALKEIENLKKTIAELDAYENETLYSLATQNTEIDLDDGVKVNYKKFGKALKKVPGLSE